MTSGSAGCHPHLLGLWQQKKTPLSREEAPRKRIPQCSHSHAADNRRTPRTIALHRHPPHQSLPYLTLEYPSYLLTYEAHKFEAKFD
ncbi:hypothetical protein E2C01_023560 [Portunus trituberculatus]|uniref:Uncharacterized protein n=1 Tax=Portunus trituberculatus TaxID=210409 RepID=A0A5B7E9C5_PORTR|nr:hypothetical protein [Portunus trituberculatus]